MKYQLLILLTLTALVSCKSDSAPEAQNDITIKETPDGITLGCGPGGFIGRTSLTEREESLSLSYNDNNTGEYTCNQSQSKIYVKFRTCDNCVELDIPSIASLLVGNVVATTVVGVAVYLIASQSRTLHVPSTKKRSDRQNQIPNEASGSSDHYQRLKPKQAQKRDEYDVLRR